MSLKIEYTRGKDENVENFFLYVKNFESFELKICLILFDRIFFK